jgi:hypothetical protein
MPSTYTLNNGIELIGTGEQSGTWGDTTNTNLGLLDVALDGQVTVALASAGSSGSPNSLPISDGTASNGRNRMVVFSDSGDLGATAYVQLTPNDAEKIIYIRNSLSGSRSVILFQGTYNASNDYEVPAGTTAVVYFDGAGAGAVAANVFNNAHFDALNVVGNVTVGGDVTVTGTVDAGTVEFDNLSGTGAVSVTNILDEDNMASDSATALSTQQSIKAYVDAQVGAFDSLAEVLAVGNTTGGTDLLVSTGDDITFADNSKAIFGVGSDLQIYHNAFNSIIQDSGTGNLYLGGDNLLLTNAALSETYLEAITNGEVNIRYDGATKLATTATGIDVTGTATVDGLTSSGNIFLDGSGNPTVINKTSGAGNNPLYRLQADTNYWDMLGVFSDADDTFRIRYNGTDAIKIANNGDISFFEATGTTPKFFWDASAESLGIGTSSPTTFSGYITVHHKNTSGDAIYLIESDGGIIGQTFVNDASGVVTTGSRSNHPWRVTTNDVERMRIDTSGNVGIGGNGTGNGLGVYLSKGTGANFFEASDGTKTMITGADSTQDFVKIGSFSAHPVGFVVANAEKMRIDSSGNVGIGTSSPSTYGGKLHVASAGSTQTSIMIQNPGIGSGHIGFDASSSNIKIYNTYATGLLADGAGIDIDSSGNVLVGKSASNSSAGAARDAAIDLGGSTNRFKDLYLSGSAYTPVVQGLGDEAGLTFGGALVAPRKNNAAADGTVDLGASSSRFKDLYLSGGVYLGGTVAANKLDDYEEGTHEVTFTTETSGTITLSATANLIRYTKVGNTVSLQGRVVVSSVSSPVGHIEISLPFAIASGAEQSIFTALNVFTHDVDLSAGALSLFAEGSATLSAVIPYQVRDDAAWLALPSGNLVGGGNEIFYIVGTYMTDS